MNIQHHVHPETLMAYAAGGLQAAMALVVGCHVESCGRCRRELDSAEALGGQMLESLEAKPLPETVRQSILARLDEAPPAPSIPDARPRAVVEPGRFIPGPLRRLLNIDSYDELRWRKLAPGIEKFNLPLREGKSFMLRIGAGLAMPVHTHKGSELTLLLQGGYHDELGEFNAGDVADLDGSTEHQPIAFEDEACICLAGMDDGLRFRGWIPTLMKPITGL